MLELAFALMMLGLLLSGFQAWRERKKRHNYYREYTPVFLTYLMEHQQEYPRIMKQNLGQAIQRFEAELEERFRTKMKDAPDYSHYAQLLESSLPQIDSSTDSCVEAQDSEAIHEPERN